MIYSLSGSYNEIEEKISNDINNGNVYLKDGYKIGGSIKDRNVVLFLEDRYGKHSSFMSEAFYGKIIDTNDGTVVKGNFRIKNYALILIIILLAVAIESIASAIILDTLLGIITPIIIIAAVVCYFVFLKRLSFNTNKIISDYINQL